MTEEQIEIARRLVARPEWPQLRLMAMLWVWDEVTQRSLPSLTSDATGGVLLGALPHGYRGERWESGEYRVLATPPRGPTATGCGTTLAEAAARALLACWEAP